MGSIKNITLAIGIIILIIGTGATKEDPPPPEFIRYNEWVRQNTTTHILRCERGFVRLPRAERDSILNLITSPDPETGLE